AEPRLRPRLQRVRDPDRRGRAVPGLRAAAVAHDRGGRHELQLGVRGDQRLAPAQGVRRRMPTMTRRTRFMAACLAIAGLLLAPLATAAHACPFMGDGAAMQASAGHGAGSEAPPPCASHCNEDNASADLAKVTPVASPALVSVLRIVAVVPPAAR